MSAIELVDDEFRSDKAMACIEWLTSVNVAASQDYVELATILVDYWISHDMRKIGIGGGQGAGKTTLCNLIRNAAAFFGEKSAILSIDDFYLRKSERAELAETIHPLLITRGPPGTHDVDLLRQTLLQVSHGETAISPIFDKGLDDRVGCRTIEPNQTLVVLEGWCVGSTPVAEEQLSKSINSLEKVDDADGEWRDYVNRELADRYSSLLDWMDCFVYLAVPDVDVVKRWRLQQEAERPTRQRLSKRAVNRFVAHYERVTLSMLAEAPNRADVTVFLDEDHGVSDLRMKSSSESEE